MDIQKIIQDYGIYFGTFIICFVSGFIPIVNAEVFLLGLSAFLNPLLPDQVFWIVFIASLSQILTKVIMFEASAGIIESKYIRKVSESQMTKLKAKMNKMGEKVHIFIFVSSLVGLPPFFLVSFVAGALRLSIVKFFIVGFAGRFIRFLALVEAPQLFHKH